MFRILRAQGGILGLSRLPMRLQSQVSQEAINIQHVRMRPKLWRPRNIAIGTFTMAACYVLFVGTVLVPLDIAAEELEKNLDEKTRKELDAAQEPLFIPFPGTITELRPQPYRGSDPEWQEFVKISRDAKLSQKIRDDLANLIKESCEKSPSLVQTCGKDLKIRRTWLDLNFPNAAPPTYERSGIEISDDYVAWVTKPVDSLTVFRLRNIMYPSAVAQSCSAFWKVLYSQNKAKVTEILGLQNTTQQPSLETMIANMNKQAKGKSGSGSQELPQNPLSPSPARSGTEPKPDGPNGLITKGGNSPSQGSSLNQSDENDPKKVLDILPMRSHFLAAYLAFRLKFSQTWKPALKHPERGSVLVFGLVELESAKAYITLDVRSAWDPKTKEYDPRSMVVGVRRLALKKQGPLVS